MVNFLDLDFIMDFKDMVLRKITVDEESMNGEVANIGWVRVWIADSILDSVAHCWLVCPYVHLSICHPSIHQFVFAR